MPIYAYICGQCSHGFELLIQGSTVPRVSQMQRSELGKAIDRLCRGSD